MACELNFIDSSSITWQVDAAGNIIGTATGSGGSTPNTSLSTTVSGSNLTVAVTDANGTVSDTVVLPAGGTSTPNTSLTASVSGNQLTVAVTDANGTVTDTVVLPSGTADTFVTFADEGGSVAFTSADGTTTERVSQHHATLENPCVVSIDDLDSGGNIAKVQVVEPESFFVRAHQTSLYLTGAGHTEGTTLFDISVSLTNPSPTRQAVFHTRHQTSQSYLWIEAGRLNSYMSIGYQQTGGPPEYSGLGHSLQLYSWDHATHPDPEWANRELPFDIATSDHPGGFDHFLTVAPGGTHNATYRAFIEGIPEDGPSIGTSYGGVTHAGDQFWAGEGVLMIKGDLV